MSWGRWELTALQRARGVSPPASLHCLPTCWLPLLLCTPPIQRPLRDCQGYFECSTLNPSNILNFCKSWNSITCIFLTCIHLWVFLKILVIGTLKTSELSSEDSYLALGISAIACYHMEVNLDLGFWRNLVQLLSLFCRIPFDSS